MRSARELVLAIADPRVCRPLLYVFLTTALAPSLSVPLLIFITSPRDAQPAGLGFTMEFLLAGTQSVMWVAMLAASALYWGGVFVVDRCFVALCSRKALLKFE